MKLNIGFAPEIRKAAWMKPRMAPMINADDADGMCLFSGIGFTTSKDVAVVSDLYTLPAESFDITGDNTSMTKRKELRLNLLHIIV